DRRLRGDRHHLARRERADPPRARRPRPQAGRAGVARTARARGGAPAAGGDDRGQAVKPLGADTTLRLASLGLAAGLWFVIVGRQTAERGVAVPVELRNVPRDLELTGDPVNAVDVRVRASPGLINSLE